MQIKQEEVEKDKVVERRKTNSEEREVAIFDCVC
jgi:hypothetical protein